MTQCIVFDLDGTLVDTLVGLKEAVNRTLKELNVNYSYSLNEVKSFIGKGALNLFKMAIKRDFTYDEFQLFLKNYEEDQYISRPYQNVLTVLKELNSLNIPIAIYSNKPNHILQKLCKILFKDINFAFIQGQDSFYPNKPDVTLLNKCLKEHDLLNKKSLYIGDSIVDIKTAKNANMDCLILTYGYGNKHEMDKEENKTYINEFKEVLKYI